MARRYADGKISDAVLESASDAAWAADGAAWAAARAARAASASASDAAWDVASDAWDAAWNAAWCVAGDAGSESANTTFYARWLTYVNGDPIPPVEPLYGKKDES